MDPLPFDLPPAAMAATNQAAAQFQLVANAPSRRYTILYIASEGCGTFHDYKNLESLEARGIRLQYVHMGTGQLGKPLIEKNRQGDIVRAPGESLNFLDNRSLMERGLSRLTSDDYRQRQSLKFLLSKQLEFYDTSKAVLLDPNGNVVNKFESTQGPQFLRELGRYLPQAQTPTRGALRS